MPVDGEREEHESYGMIGLSRITTGGHGANLFGSSIRHHSFVRLRVRTAVKERGLNTNWFYAKKHIVELDLSPTQFADMVSAMNVGDGVPCTLRYANGRMLSECPEVDERQKFSDEFKAQVLKVSERAAKLCTDAEAILSKPTILKGDRATLIRMMQMLMQEIQSNIPFTQRQFTEAMDKTVSECKGEVEAFIQNKIVSLGIEALRDQVALVAPEIPEPKLLEERDEKEPHP